MYRHGSSSSRLIGTSCRLPRNTSSHVVTRQFAVYASRGVDNHDSRTQEDEKPPPSRLLDPFVLSKRLQHLCDVGQIDDAVALLKTMPRDAQNTVVWNGMLRESMRERRYSLAFSLFVDMKRRGFYPSIATYVTMLNGLVQIKDWESRPKQLAQTHELFESLETFVVTRAESYPWTGREMNNGAVTHYMRILGNARLYDKMFEVFHGLPPIGPLSPGAHEYSSLFTCLIERPPTEDQTSAEARMKNAADARFLWESVVRRSERVDVDATLLHQVIRALSFGKRAEHALVFDIIHDYLGLEKPQPRVKADTPSDTSPHKPDLGFGGARTQTNEDAVIERKPPRQLVEFSSPLLQWVLEFCNYTRHYELCAQWLRVVMKRDHEGDWQIPDSGHIQQGLLAFAGAALRASHEGAPGNGEPRKVVRLLEEVTREIAYHPSKARALELSGSAFEVAMATCTFGKDWSSATKVFELMAGYDLAVFADGRDHTPQKLPRSGYFQLNPDTITMGYLARLAIELKDASIQRQCVRAVLALGGARLLEYTPYDKAHDKYAPFYKQKMAHAVIKLADTTDRVGLALDVETQHRWKLLASAADKVLRHTREFDDVPVPPVERRSVPELSSAARYKKSRGAGRR